jgi:hypothetical protein
VLPPTHPSYRRCAAPTCSKDTRGVHPIDYNISGLVVSEQSFLAAPD